MQVDMNSSLREATVWWEVVWERGRGGGAGARRQKAGQGGQGVVPSIVPLGMSKGAKNNQRKRLYYAERGLQAAAGRMQSAITRTMRSKFTPKLKFKRDEGRAAEVESRFERLGYAVSDGHGDDERSGLDGAEWAAGNGGQGGGQGRNGRHPEKKMPRRRPKSRE